LNALTNHLSVVFKGEAAFVILLFAPLFVIMLLDRRTTVVVEGKGERTQMAPCFIWGR
jgi:hypothetical protein